MQKLLKLITLEQAPELRTSSVPELLERVKESTADALTQRGVTLQMECHAERLDMDTDLINDNGGDGDLSIDINKVRLNLMRVRTKSSKDMGLVIPVWDYYGSEGPIEETIVLTINAIDGSMVSRELGY